MFWMLLGVGGLLLTILLLALGIYLMYVVYINTPKSPWLWVIIVFLLGIIGFIIWWLVVKPGEIKWLKA